MQCVLVNSLLCLFTHRKASAPDQGFPGSRHHCASDQSQDSQKESRSGVNGPSCQTTHTHTQPWRKGHRSENKHCGSGAQSVWAPLYLNEGLCITSVRRNHCWCNVHLSRSFKSVIVLITRGRQSQTLFNIVPLMQVFYLKCPLLVDISILSLEM